MVPFIAVAIDYRIDFLTQKPRATSSSQNDPGEECLRSEKSLSSTQEIMNNVAKRYLKTENPSNREELDKFVAYMEKVRKVIVVDVKTGSLIFTLECGSVQILDELWEDYSTGHLNEVAQYYLVTKRHPGRVWSFFIKTHVEYQGKGLHGLSTAFSNQ